MDFGVTDRRLDLSQSIALSGLSGLIKSVRAFGSDFASVTGRRGRVALVYLLAGAALEGVSLSLLAPLIGLIFGAPGSSGALGHFADRVFADIGVHEPRARMLVTLGLFGALLALRTVVIAARDMAMFDVQLRFVDHQRLRIAGNLATARWDRLGQLNYARITNLVGGDIQRLAIGIQLMLRAVAAGAILVAQLCLAFFLSPQLALIIVAILIIGSLAAQPALVQARRLGGEVTDANLSLFNSAAQFLAGLKLAASEALESRLLDETRKTLQQIGDRLAANTRGQIVTRSVLTCVAAITAAGLVFAGFAWLRVPPSILITLLLVVTRMIAPVGQIYVGAQQLSYVLAIYDRARDVNAELERFKRTAQPRSHLAYSPSGTIAFDRVSFRHVDRDSRSLPAHPKGVFNLSLRISPGEFLGITGKSGAGKTTFADLLVGLYAPQTGRITVGGEELDVAHLTAWQTTLSYVPQDTVLFHDTVRRNLCWIDPAASESQLWESLTLADADDLVRGMAGGLDTVVGERGALMAGGERQRLALARALLRRPKLLILDEATSAIDSEGERDILCRLRQMPERPTIVLIAHRTENLPVCDRVLRFETSLFHTTAREDGEIANTANAKSR